MAINGSEHRRSGVFDNEDVVCFSDSIL